MCVDSQVFLTFFRQLELLIRIRQIELAKDSPSSQRCERSSALGSGHGLDFNNGFTDTLKSPHVRIVPLRFGTQTIGDAHSVLSTFFITPSCSRHSISLSTFSLTSYGTDLALQNTGLTPSLIRMSALCPLMVPKPGLDTAWCRFQHLTHLTHFHFRSLRKILCQSNFILLSQF